MSVTPEAVTPEAITRYILDTFEGVDVQVVEPMGASFFFYGPERMFPFATIVTQDDAYDAFSRLDRPDVARLNIGVGKDTFHTLIGPPPADAATSGIDYTALDRLMPHPVYARQLWVSVLNPGEGAWPTVQTLLAEAYRMAVEKENKRLAREGNP